MKSLLVLALIMLAPHGTWAMNAPQPKPGVVTQKKMVEAALVLLDVMNADGAMQTQMNAIVDEQVKSMGDIPCADRVVPQLRDIMSEALNYNALRGDLANVYATNFTLDELNWMVDFYKTPLGIKMQKTQPVIYQTITDLSAARMKAAEPKISALFASNLNTEACQQRGRK